MSATASSPWMTNRLDALRAELADLAFVLETQGRRDAADVANLLRARLAALADDSGAENSSRRPSLFADFP